MKTTETLKNYLLFTDLDGTLLDHDNYSFDQAKEMLTHIKETKTPLIIVTSKTKDEVLELQKKLNISYPFIIENGAGICIPDQEKLKIIPCGKVYAETLDIFNEFAKIFSMKGFHQMSDTEVAALTGLPLEKAILAKQRTFSEPFILVTTSDLKLLKQLANESGFDVVKGGRFYHLITKGQDKANALLEVQKYYEKIHNTSYRTIALGDGENDITMLSAVDQGILIKKPDHTYVECEIENIIRSEFIGPQGWNESLKRFFKC